MKKKLDPELRALPVRSVLYPKPEDDVNLIYHRFMRAFVKDDDKFNRTNHALMVAVEKWAKRYPDQVFLTYCDDDVHATSLLVFIEHSSKKSYFGTTVVYIPQCNGVPSQFFLYPNHKKDLMGILKKLGKKRI